MKTCWLLVVAGALMQAQSGQDAITADLLLGHVKALASDSFEGRGVATAGEEKSVQYLIDEMKKMGLKPGNPDGTWVQQVGLMGLKTTATAGFTVGGKAIAAKEKTDIVTVSRRFASKVEVKDSPLVFVGYGVVAPEYGWDDYKGVDVKNKTIVMLINDPQVPNPRKPKALDPKLFKGDAMTYYGRWTYKYEIASKKGAAAAIIIHETDLAAYPFAVVRDSWGQENFDLDRADGNTGRVAAEAWVTREKAVELLAASGLNLDELKTRANRRDFRPVDLKGTVSMTLENETRKVASKNVIGQLPGSDPVMKGEYVLYSAHWDHLGRNAALTGDQIFNGAVDNATGCSALLAIAKALTNAPTTKRTSLFLFPTAEEKGLLGSLYYAENPVYPMAKTVANINVDGFNVWGRTSDVVLIGMGASTLDDLAATLAKEQGRVAKPDPEPEKGYFYRSDHVEFMKKGVPAMYVKAGAEYRGKDNVFGEMKRGQYTTQRYHKPADEVDAKWDLSGAVEDVRLMYLAGSALANGRAKAEWKPGSEFKR